MWQFKYAWPREEHYQEVWPCGKKCISVGVGFEVPPNLLLLAPQKTVSCWLSSVIDAELSGPSPALCLLTCLQCFCLQTATSDSGEAKCSDTQAASEKKQKQNHRNKKRCCYVSQESWHLTHFTKQIPYLFSLAGKRGARREENAEDSGCVGARDYYSHLLICHCSYTQKSRPETTAANSINAKKGLLDCKISNEEPFSFTK